MKRGLRTDGHRRVAEWLTSKAVGRVAGVVVKQVEVVAIVGLVAGRGQHRQRRHGLTRLQRNETLRRPGARPDGRDEFGRQRRLRARLRLRIGLDVERQAALR